MSRNEVVSLAVLVFVAGLIWGWILAHGAVATECSRLGGFYAGNKTFTCSLKEAV